MMVKLLNGTAAHQPCTYGCIRRHDARLAFLNVASVLAGNCPRLKLLAKHGLSFKPG